MCLIQKASFDDSLCNFLGIVFKQKVWLYRLTFHCANPMHHKGWGIMLPQTRLANHSRNCNQLKKGNRFWNYGRTLLPKVGLLLRVNEATFLCLHQSGKPGLVLYGRYELGIIIYRYLGRKIVEIFQNLLILSPSQPDRRYNLCQKSLEHHSMKALNPIIINFRSTTKDYHPLPP